MNTSINDITPVLQQEQVKTEIKVENFSVNKTDTKMDQVETDTKMDQVQQETEQQINWKKWKESRQKEREEAELMKKKAMEKEAEAEALKAAMDALLNKQTNNQISNSKHQFNEDLDETEDERIDKKVQLALKKAEETRLIQEKQKEVEELPRRLAQNNPDFHQVCSAENLDYLEFHYPEIAQAFQHMPEGYKKWENIYKTVKRFVPNTNSQQIASKAEKNFNKPQSISSSSVTQPPAGDHSSFLSEDKKAANWARMQKIRNSLEN